MAAMALPSICIVAPIGSVTSRISFGTFIFSVCSKLVGRLANELWVARDVMVIGN